MNRVLALLSIQDFPPSRDANLKTKTFPFTKIYNTHPGERGNKPCQALFMPYAILEKIKDNAPPNHKTGLSTT